MLNIKNRDRPKYDENGYDEDVPYRDYEKEGEDPVWVAVGKTWNANAPTAPWTAVDTLCGSFLITPKPQDIYVSIPVANTSKKVVTSTDLPDDLFFL